MSAITTTWLMVAAACLTLATIHAQIWLLRRQARANAAFAMLAVSVAAIGFVELGMAHAESIVAYGRMLWWYQLPIWSGVVAVVWFVRLYLRAGSAWLGWTAVGLRTLALAINFGSSPSIHFSEITALHKLALLGDTITVVQGVPNPWLASAHLSLLALLLFVVTASRDLWRRGERRRAVTIGGGLILLIGASTALAAGYFWGISGFPNFVAPFFLPVVLAMGYELGLDLLRTARLADEVSAKDAALQDSQRKLALAADAADAGLWSIDAGSGRLWATPRALAMYGLAGDREHGVDDVLQAVHLDDRDRVRDFIGGQIARERQAAIEYRVVGGGGELRWLVSRGGVHPAAPGTAGSMTGVTVDISERKRAEDETARQRAQLEHLSRVATLSELSGALAHELNQPLAIVMSNAEAAQRLLDRPAPDLAEIGAILRDIVDADERAGEVIRRLRSLLQRGAPDRQPLAINGVVEGVLRLMRADLLRRGVAVQPSLAHELPPVSVDRVPIEQVLINVIGNACDAMAGNVPGERTLGVATCALADAVEVRISDNGTGLPADAQRVFEPFYTTKPQGLGLGLAISRSIVDAHGGRLCAEPNAGRGTTLRIALPLAPEVT